MPRVHISVIQRIQLRPKHIGLENQGVNNALLLLGRAGLAQHIPQPDLYVPWFFFPSFAELVQRFIVCKVVMLEQSCYSLPVNAGGT